MAVAYPKPNVGAHAFIDEAGEFGIKPPKENKKASSWFVLAAVVISDENINKIDAWYEEIKTACGLPSNQALHYRRLSEENKIIACQMISGLPIRCFIFCSHKANMRGYSNDRAAAVSKTKSWFFNSCVKYLLERVTDFCKTWCIREFGEHRHVNILIAENPLAPISELKSYLEKEIGNIRGNLHTHNARPLAWEVLNVGLIADQKAELNSGLQLADIVASAFYAGLGETDRAIQTVGAPALALKRVVWDGSLENNRDFGFPNNGITVWPVNRPLAVENVAYEFLRKFGLDLKTTK